MAVPDNKGIMDQISGGIGEVFKFPDKLPAMITSNKTAQVALRKVFRIIFCAIVIILALGVLYMSIHGLHFGGWFDAAFFTSLMNPTFSTAMMAPMLLAAAGFGGAFLLKELFPKKCHYQIDKITKLAVPLLLVGGGAALVVSPFFIFGAPLAFGSSYIFLGLVAMGFSPIAYHHFHRRQTINFMNTRPKQEEGQGWGLNAGKYMRESVQNFLRGRNRFRTNRNPAVDPFT